MSRAMKFRSETLPAGSREVLPVEPLIVRLMSHLRRRPAVTFNVDSRREVRTVRPAQRYEVFCDRDLPGDRP